jgi:hypothetical protein
MFLFCDSIDFLWCHGSIAAAMPIVMLDDPGSNPGVNHGCLYLSRRTNVFCLVLSSYVVYRQLGKKPVDVSVYFADVTAFLVLECIFFAVFGFSSYPIFKDHLLQWLQSLSQSHCDINSFNSKLMIILNPNISDLIRSRTDA